MKVEPTVQPNLPNASSLSDLEACSDPTRPPEASGVRAGSDPAKPTPAAGPSSVLDRTIAGLPLERLLHGLVFGAAVVLCLYHLGTRPYHHDESIHAFYSWKIVQDGPLGYRYDPVYHGTVLYYASALAMRLFGASDATGRLSAVAFGLGVIAFAWPLRRYLGRWGALCFATGLACSPSWIYFARFVRHDVYLACCNLGAVYFAFRYGETRRFWYLPLSAAFLGVAFATKEDNYFLAVIFLVGFVLMLVWEVVAAEPGQRAPTRAAVWREARVLLAGLPVPLLVSAIAFLVPWTLFYSGFLHNEKYWTWSEPWRLFRPIPDALKYWTGQHGVERIGGPWWYYLPQLLLYEPLLCVGFLAALIVPLATTKPRTRFDRGVRYTAAAAACGLLVLAAVPDYGAYKLSSALNVKAGTAWLLLTLGSLLLGFCRVSVPDRFMRFCILWTLGTLVTYSWAQEKVPWLLVPQVLPLALVAARWFGIMIEERRIPSAPIRVALAVTGGLTVWTLINANYRWDAMKPGEPGAALDPPVRHHEMLAYVQSTYDIPMIVGRIEEMGRVLGTGTKTRLQAGGDATWPLSWYLRDWPVNWDAAPHRVDTPVVIVDRKQDTMRAMEKVLGDDYEEVPFAIRGWWTWEHTLPNVPALLRFLIFREAWSGTGSSDAVAYIRKRPVAGMTFGPYEVNPPPAAVGWPAPAAPITAAAVWGSKGSARGLFNEPRALAVDAAGAIYVADSKNHRIQKLGPNGEALAVWGREGNGNGEFKEPHGVALGPDGNLYVADTWNHRVVKLDPNGAVLKTWGEGLFGPRAIAVAADGTVYLADTGNKLIRAYSPDGAELRKFGGEGIGPGQLIEPVGIAIDSQGRVVVADTGNHRLQFFTAGGAFVQEWRVYGWTDFYSEPYIAASNDTILVTDAPSNRFARYRGPSTADPPGGWGGPGSDSGQFNHPAGIAVGPDGAVYVSDTVNNRIQKVILR